MSGWSYVGRPSVRSMSIKPYKTIVKVRIWVSGLCSSFSSRHCHSVVRYACDNIKPQMVPFVLPVRYCVGFRPTSRFGLRCGPSVLRDVMFLHVPCVARLHTATGEALTVVAQEHAVYIHVKVEGPLRSTRTTFTSCRYGSLSQWRDHDNIIRYSWEFPL